MSTPQISHRIIFAFLIWLTVVLFSGTSLYAQTNAPSIQSGVTFQWRNTQTVPADSATLESITINGVPYSEFIVPNVYTLTQLGPNGHNTNNIKFNGGYTETTSSSSTWNSSALAALGDRNLNHYFEANGNGDAICDNYTAEETTNSQRQTLSYSPGVKVNINSLIAITERNANNCLHVELFGTPAGGGATTSLGETFVNQDDTEWGYGGTGTSSSFGTPGAVNPPTQNPSSGVPSDYWLSDRVLEGYNTIGIALFYLEDIAPLGSIITSVQLTASTIDHGDGKVFMVSVAYTTLAENDINQTPMDTPVDGNVLTNDTDPQGDEQMVQSALADTDGDGLIDDDLPLGIPTNIYDGVTLAGSMTLNSDGTYSFIPASGYTGTVPLEYTAVDDNIYFQVTDDATLTIEVIPDQDPTNNNPPIAQDDVNTTEQDVAVSNSIILNDSDPDGDALTVNGALADTDGDGEIDDPLTLGTSTKVYGTNEKGETVVAGAMTLNADGSYTFDPQPYFTGELPIDYTISDNNGGTDDAILTITIDPSDPLDNHTYANDDANVGIQGDEQTGNILTNDSDPEGHPTTVTAASISGGLPMIIDGVTTNILPSGGSLILSTDGSYTYTPDPDFVGTEIVEYTKCDNETPQACETATLYLTTIQVYCSTVSLKVLLEGPWISAKTMTTDLNDNHLLPGQDKDLSLNFAVRILANYTPFGQPYTVAPWNYSGNLGLQFGDASSPLASGTVVPYDADVVDWVLVTVREGGVLPADNIWKCAGWLKSNGDVTFPEECDCLRVRPSEDYYIMVEHRNHLGILSPTPVNKLSGTAILEWDFTIQDSYRSFVFRVGQKEIATGIWAMYAGNGNQNPGVEAINSSDQTVWKNDQNEINYLFGDFNLNVVANSEDETIWKNNQNSTSGVIFY